MSLKVLPADLAKRMAPKKVIDKLVTQNLTVNRAAVTMLARSGIMGERALERIAIRTIRQYKKAIAREKREGASAAEAKRDVVGDKRLMAQRVRAGLTKEIVDEVKDQYRGEFYEWVPSSAQEPDPEHQLNYGKRFQLGKGEAPGDRFGCQCGMNILTDETRLKLE